jgi:hypothetical protein
MKTRIVKRENTGFDDEFIVQQRDCFMWIDLYMSNSLEDARLCERRWRKANGEHTKETVIEEKS